MNKNLKFRNKNQSQKVISEADFLAAEKREEELEQIFSNEQNIQNPTKPLGKTNKN